MKTIELSAAMASAPVQENLKNFAGLDAQNALGLMTPERLAAVAGGLIDNARFHKINLTPGELTCIGEGQGILIIQQPYRNAILQAYLVCYNQCKPIAGSTGTSLSITVGKDEQVFIKENDAKACNIRYVSFLLKNKFYYQ